MYGFVLRNRKHGKDCFSAKIIQPEHEMLMTFQDRLDVNKLSEPQMAVDAIDRLVMRPERNKDMVKAVVKTYVEEHVKRKASLVKTDFIRGKGEGQIFLLHGPPGTGKTLTAGELLELSAQLREKGDLTVGQSVLLSSPRGHC